MGLIVGTFDELSVGETFTSPPMTIDDERLSAIVSAGGYTHPLFADPAFAAASVFGRRPVPGQGLLLVMGGLAEQTERFDDTVIALVGLDEVSFRAPAFAGDEVRCEIEVLAKEPKGERGLLTMVWRARNAAGELLCEARARMLFRLS